MSNVTTERTVTLLYSQEAKKYPIKTTVMTWGELKEKAEAMGCTFDNKKVRLRENKSLLDIPQSQLMDGDITLFVYPDKQKAGAACKSISERIAEVENSIKELQIEVFGECRHEEPVVAIAEIKKAVTKKKVAKKAAKRVRPSRSKKLAPVTRKPVAKDNDEDLDDLLDEARELEG